MRSLLTRDFGEYAVELMASPDNLRLFISVVPKSAVVIPREILTDFVKEAGVLGPIDLAVLDDVIRAVGRGDDAKSRRIKKGRDSEPSHDGKLLLLVRPFTGIPTITEGTREIAESSSDSNEEIKFDEEKKKHAFLDKLHLFDNIRSGQIVARLYPPKLGKDGEDVFGKVIPSPPGKEQPVTVDATLSIDSGTLAKEGYSIIEAKVEGYLSSKEEVLQINQELHIKENLDFHYGSIDFIGTVRITGNVSPGFTVSGVKGVLVEGDVREANLISKQGGIEVKGFAFGGRHSKMVCTGDLKLKVGQEVHAEVLGVISIQKEAVDCFFRTQAIIDIKEGRILGGRAQAVCGIEAKECGGEAGTKTELQLGSTIEVGSDYGKLKAQIEEHDRALKLLQAHLGPFKDNPSRINFLAPEHKKKMGPLIAKYEAVEKSRVKLLEKRAELLTKGKMPKESWVTVHKVFHPGVTVTAGEVLFSVKENLAGPCSITFDFEKKEFTQGDARPVACSWEGGEATQAPIIDSSKDA